MAEAVLIGLDWGTTSLRAYLLGADGAVTYRAEHPLGILQVKDGDFAGAFRQATASLPGGLPSGLPAIAAGMIGSRQGWREAPYVECPAEWNALAKGLVRIDSVHIVPGVSVVDADGIPDVMRGEETQIAGAFDDRASGIAVLPGTHSKWALVERGRIARFATFMTGEIFAALSAHTILGRLMQGTEFHAGGFAQGVSHAARDVPGRGGLLHRLFSARTLGLFDKIPKGLGGAAIHSYLSGLLIGAEIAEARAWLGRPPANVTLIGAASLSDAYKAALAQLGIVAETAPADAAARGLWRIARAAAVI